MMPLGQLVQFLRRHLLALGLALTVAVILIAEAPAPAAPGEQEFLSVHPAVTVIVMAGADDAENVPVVTGA